MNDLLLSYYNVYINHDPVMALTNFSARSTWDAYAFEWGKLSFKGKILHKMGSWTEKQIEPRGSSVPTPGQHTVILP